MPRRFVDLAAGQRYDCGSVTPTIADVVSFAERFDPLPMHVDPDADTPFDGLIASSSHTLALTQRLVVDGFYADSDIIASMGYEELTFPAPLRPGDEMRVHVDVLDTRPSNSQTDRGVVTTRREGVVDGTPVLRGINHTLWLREDE